MSSAAAFENAREQRTPVDLVIRGSIPPWLSGVLYRTGPGTMRLPKSTTGTGTEVEPETIDVQHWFDGFAMHHRFEIFPGGMSVKYSSRKGAEDLENRIIDNGSLDTYSFGQISDPCQSIFRKFFTAFKYVRDKQQGNEFRTPSGVSVNVTLSPDMPGAMPSASRKLDSPSQGPHYIVAKSDNDKLQVIDAESLQPLKSFPYKSIDPRLDGQLFAAHSCKDGETGEIYNFSCKLGGRFPIYKIFRISTDDRVDVLAEIKDAPASYIHSFAMTKRYIILCVWQAYITQ
jgi:torulene dioxygenase